MSVNSEEKIYNDLMNEVPNQTVSGDTKQSATALAGAESTATGQVDNYKSTYSGKLDDAISNYLTGRGFEYDPTQDKAYQQYRKEFAQNAAMARDTSRNTAKQLSGGYNPTYADTVANEVYNDRMGNISDAESTFRGLAQQDYQAKQEKNANVLNLYNTLEGTDYSRNRDTVGDYKNYLNLLASRYSTDRQADVNLDSANNDVYSTKLNGAVNNLSSARAADSQRYLYDTVSANQLAQNAQAERENAQKIEYERNKAAYTAYTKAQKAAEKAKAKAEKNKGKTENANAVFASMGVTKNDFKKGTGNKEDGALYKEGGAVNYTVYAQTYIDEKYREGYINDDERDYLYKKIGITSDESKYNSELADSYATTMGLDKQKNKKYIRGSIIQGHNMGQLSAADVAYLSAKYGLSLDD